MYDNEKIIKEDGMMFIKSRFNYIKGMAVITHKRIYFYTNKGIFNKKTEILLDIPIKNVRSASAKKVLAHDGLEIRYNENGQVKSAIFKSPDSKYTIIAFSRDPLMEEWSKAINKLL